MEKTVLLADGKPVDFTLLPTRPLFLANEPYMLYRNRAEGESDLLELARKALAETMWVYSQDESIWYNIRRGCKQEYESDGNIDSYSSGVSVDTLDYSQLGKTLTVYHIHNKNFPKLVERMILERYPDANEEGKLKKWRRRSANDMALPSPEDIDHYINLLQITSHSTSIDFMLVSEHGFTNIRYDTLLTHPGLTRPGTAIMYKLTIEDVIDKTLPTFPDKYLVIDEIIRQINDLIPEITLEFRAV